MLHTAVLAPPVGQAVIGQASWTPQRRERSIIGQAHKGQRRKHDQSKLHAPSTSDSEELHDKASVRFRTMTWPSQVKLIGPVHHRQNTAPRPPTTLVQDRSGATKAVDTARYRWSSDGHSGHTYRKRNFWNLQRGSPSRCLSAASSHTPDTAIHVQGSHPSLHHAKPMNERELQLYLTVNQKLAAGHRIETITKPGNWSEYFMSFKPLHSAHRTSHTDVSKAGSKETAMDSQPGLYPHPLAPPHRQPENSLGSVMMIKQLPSPGMLAGSGSLYSSRGSRSAPLPGLTSARLSSRHLASTASVASDRPQARPCTPASGMYSFQPMTFREEEGEMETDERD